MTVKEMIEKGVMTLREFDAMVLENTQRANRFGVRLTWELSGKDIIGKVFHENRLLQEKRYTAGYQHRRQALMHLDFYYFLNIKQRQYNEIQRMKKEEFAEIARVKKNEELTEYHKNRMAQHLDNMDKI